MTHQNTNQPAASTKDDEARQIVDQAMPDILLELQAMAKRLANSSTENFFGQTEFALRDACHRIGASVLQSALEVRKKGGTKGPALRAQPAQKTQPSSTTGVKP